MTQDARLAHPGPQRICRGRRAHRRRRAAGTTGRCAHCGGPLGGRRANGPRLHDPLETELPDLGLLVFEDAETGEQLFVDTADQGFRRRFVEAAERREQTIGSAFRRAGVDALALATNEDLVGAIVRMAARRRMRRR